jgi:hypothetical protein
MAELLLLIFVGFILSMAIFCRVNKNGGVG